MFKFLRKYSVWILGFGGTLLLIAFLAPNVIQQLAQRAGVAGTVQATVGDGEKVSYDAWQQIVAESQVIDRFGTSIPGVGFLESPSHWFLLSREADLAGFTPPIQAIGIDDQTLFNIAGNAGAQPITVARALAHLQGIERLIRTYRTAGKFSDRRLLQAASDLFSAVEVESIVIPATPEDNGSFSDAALQAQLDQWADTTPGEGDHGFGYKLPDRFKIEWLHIPADSIKEATKLSAKFSSREQRKFWRRNENDPRFPLVDSSGIIPESVTEAFLETLTAQTRLQLSSSISEQLRNPRRGFQESKGYIDLPENWGSLQLGFEQLASALQHEFNIALPAYGNNPSWTTTSDINNLPILGSILVTNLGDTPVTCQTLISSAKEFQTDGVFRIQQSVASTTLVTTDNDLLIFRITETDPARVPNNLDEVRTAVVQDLGRIARWETLQAEADIIEKLAREEGMLAVSAKYGVVINSPQLVSMVDTGVPAILDPATRRPLMSQSIVQRLSVGDLIEDMNSAIPTLEKNDNQVIQAIIDRAAKLPIDTPVSSLTVDQQMFVIPSPENMSLVIVRVTNTSPASSELANAFTIESTGILQALMSFDELGGAINIEKAFSFSALASRHNYTRGRQNIEETEDETVATVAN